MPKVAEPVRAGEITMNKRSAGRADARRRTGLGLALWVAAIAAAYYAQNLLTPGGKQVVLPPEKIVTASWWYAAAAAAALAAALVIDRYAPPAAPAISRLPAVPGARQWPPPRQFSAVTLILAGLATSGVALYLSAGPKAYSQSLAIWLLSLPIWTAGVALGTWHPWQLRRPRIARWQMIELLIVLGILALALALRLPNLAQIPPDVHGDEGAVGIEARRVLHGEVSNFFAVGWAGIPYLSYSISALFMRLFGDNLYGLRMASVFQGTLSVLLLYLIAKRLFSVRVAAIAAFLLAVSQWDIHFSRSGLVNIQAQFAGLLLFYFLLRGIKSRRAVDFLLAGFAVGLTMSVYFAARLAAVSAAIYVLHKVIGERGFLRQHWPGLLTMGLGTLIFFAPIGAYYAYNPTAFTGRMQTAFWVNNPQYLKHELYSYNTDRVEDVLRMQAVNSALAFNLRGETSLQYGHKAPLIDFWTSALFVPGVVVATLRPRQARYLLLAVWFWLTFLLGSVLTTDAMSSPHLVGIVPLLFIFPALVIDTGWRGVGMLLGRRAGGYGFALPVLAFLALATLANYNDYFETHTKKHMPGGFYTILSRYIESINDRYRVYLIGSAQATLHYDTPRFLLPDVDGVDVRDLPLPLPITRVPERKGVAFIVSDAGRGGGERLAAIKRVYPDGKEGEHRTTTGVLEFYSYLVEHESLLQANPNATIDHAPVRRLTPAELEKSP